MAARTGDGSSTSRFEKPGLRSPMAGYMGHVPGMIALNMHGGVWRDLVLQDPQLHRTAAATAATPRLRPMSARVEYTTQLPNEGAALQRPRPWSAQGSKPGFQETKDMMADGADATFSGSRFGSENSKENNFMPRMDKQWAPPVVGYGGHVPGYASGNLHGSPWKDLLTPTRKDTGVSSRRISSPLRQTGAEGPGSRPTSAKANSPMSQKLPNNIKGYLDKHRVMCSPGGGTPRSAPRSAR